MFIIKNKLKFNETKGLLKKYIAESLARYQIEQGFEVDNYQNWILAAVFVDGLFD